jgi:hypothetical protein
MLHSKRIWTIVPAVNDATSADGAQEYGVLRADGDHYAQIESLAFSWMRTSRRRASFAASWRVNSTMQPMARSPGIGFRRRSNTAAAICAHDDRAVSIYSNRLKARGFCTPPGHFLFRN